jgi:hypothetical protein
MFLRLAEGKEIAVLKMPQPSEGIVLSIGYDFCQRNQFHAQTMLAGFSDPNKALETGVVKVYYP